MFKFLTPFWLAALVSLPVASAAQQTTPPEPPAAETPAEDAPGSELDLGQPVGEGPQLGERYSQDKFGDWDLACIRTEAEKDPCSLLQILNDENGRPVAEISLFRLKGRGAAVAGATVIVPLETLLTQQMTISVDGSAGKRYNYSFCNPIGCIAQIGLTEADIASFKRGKVARVTIVPAPAPDQKVELTMSLSGFTAGFDAVDVVEN